VRAGNNRRVTCELAARARIRRAVPTGGELEPPNLAKVCSRVVRAWSERVGFGQSRRGGAVSTDPTEATQSETPNDDNPDTDAMGIDDNDPIDATLVGSPVERGENKHAHSASGKVDDPEATEL
jgi:hypothetical protein